MYPTAGHIPDTLAGCHENARATCRGERLRAEIPRTVIANGSAARRRATKHAGVGGHGCGEPVEVEIRRGRFEKHVGAVAQDPLTWLSRRNRRRLSRPPVLP